MRSRAAGFRGARECGHSYTLQKRAPTFAPGRGGYIRTMNDGILFADPELPFHVWVRERSGDNGYRWVLREAPSRDKAAPDAPDPEAVDD